MSAAQVVAALKKIMEPELPENDRWLMRVMLLETAGIPVSSTNLSRIGGTTVDKTNGAVAVLKTNGLVDFTPDPADE